jgi:predicted amidohydrolase YtcJ
MWDRRHRLEHGGNVLWTAARAARCKQLGISPVPNVGFIHIYGEFWPSVFGEARARARVPLRTMLDQGFEIAGSSDTTGGDLVMMNPFHNMWAMITRQSYKGNVLDAEEAIDLDEALTVYTRNGAIAGRYLDSRGTLEIGKLADVVIASADLHAIPIDEIRHVKADCTIVDGVIAQVRPEIEGTLLK